ncbi:trafficking protein particle complex subunit 6A isoform X2 [Ochotona princeps]|uniref:trafficking protein particle complex subunit 6A isoform X2 n=1 Tax=Ochotona princeps TaxID=9978 RepID=UPI0027153FF3|nr:trafficking protein particle complex subunit 6A isoform X2 [Ochotona princeps]
MADSVLFEFLHQEMVAEFGDHDPDPSTPGGQRVTLSVLESLGFRVGQALGERLPQDTLVFREELDVLKFLCRDLWVAAFRDLRSAGQQLPPPAPHGLWPAVSGGSSQVPGLPLWHPARQPPHPGLQELGHRLCGSPARL